MAETLIATAAGEFAPTFLTKEATKVGIKQFIQTYGSVAFRTVAPAITGGMLAAKAVEAYPPVDLQKEKLFGVPLNRITGQNTGYNDIEEPKKVEPLKYIPEIHGGKSLPPTEQESLPAQTEVKKWDEGFKKPDLIETNKGFEVPPQTKAVPPGFDIPDTVDTSILTKDIAKQTKDLVKEKPEFGALTETEKQTSIALKGDKPDYYSRAVEAIETAKDDTYTKGKWASILKSSTTKDELDYLGLTEVLMGKESISKQELLKLVKDKDIASDLVFTKIPKEGQLDFSTFSIGGAGNTTGQYVIQLAKDSNDIKDLEFGLSKKIYQATGAHLKEKYGKGAVVHARTQIGFNPMEDNDFINLPPREKVLKITNPVIKNASEKLNNTFIIDEIQSDWIQDIQKFGTKDKPKLTALKGSEITPEYITDNYGDFYTLKIEKYQTQKDLLEKTGMSTNKVLYRTDETTGIKHVEKRIEDDMYYVFYYKGMTPESKSVAFQDKETAMDSVKASTIEGLPIIESKKYVELMLNSLIKEAVLNGTDSIGITNGQIQGDRYEGQAEKDAEGLKKFYDKIVIPQLEKIAKKYGVITESININEPELTEAEDVKSIPNRMKMSMQNGFVLKKVNANILYATLNNPISTIPDFFTIYSTSGRAQGSSRIMDIIEVDEPNIGRRINFPKQYFIWVKEGSALSETLSNRPNEMVNLRDYFDNSTVDYSMPLAIATPNGISNLTEYSDYILNYKSKGIDLGYEHDEHQIIKMPLPKKLQKNILSGSIKLSKRNTLVDELVTQGVTARV